MDLRMDGLNWVRILMNCLVLPSFLESFLPSTLLSSLLLSLLLISYLNQLRTDELTALPQEIGQLSDLTELVVRRDCVSSGWRWSSSLLSYLVISHSNQLSCNRLTLYPPEIGQFSKLAKLDVRRCLSECFLSHLLLPFSFLIHISSVPMVWQRCHRR